MSEKTIKIVPSNASINADKKGQAFGSFIDDGTETTFNPLLRQILASLGPIIITISSGMVSGYSAILLPQLDEPDSDIKVTKNQESWIASMATIPMAIGCIFGGWSMEQFGRKKGQLIAAILFAIGWCFIYFATSVEELLLGRLITGFCVGAVGPSVTNYLAESSHPKYRGFFLATIALGIAFGLSLTHLIGTYLDWRTTALLMLTSPIATVFLLLPVPESYVWYINRNDFKRAKESFFWLRGRNQESKEELVAALHKQTIGSRKQSWRELLHVCSKAQFIKPMMILNVFFCTVQFAGNNAVVFYSVTIMQSTVSNMDKYTAMLIVDSIRLAMSFAACVLTKKVKVRPLTLISGYGTAFSLFLLSLFVHLSKENPDNSLYASVPLVALVLYIIFISIGLVPLPWSLCGELYSPATKGIGGGISTAINFLAFFIVVKTSPDMFDNLGTAGTFTTYGCFAFAGTVIMYFVLPETKGKTLKEIEEYFVSKKKMNANDIL